MNKKQEWLWQLYIDMIEFLKTYMKLYNWTIVLQWTDDLPNGVTGRLESCYYDYYNATILISRDLFIPDDIDDDFDEITTLLIHEICHIFTGTWTSYMEDEINESNMTRFIWRDMFWEIVNSMRREEEKMTNIIDEVIYKWVKETKEYKQFDKKFTSLNK